MPARADEVKIDELNWHIEDNLTLLTKMGVAGVA
jgi:hypothetical protein